MGKGGRKPQQGTNKKQKAPLPPPIHVTKNKHNNQTKNRNLHITNNTDKLNKAFCLHMQSVLVTVCR